MVLSWGEGKQLVDLPFHVATGVSRLGAAGVPTRPVPALVHLWLTLSLYSPTLLLHSRIHGSSLLFSL